MVAAYAKTWNTGGTPFARVVTLGVGSITDTLSRKTGKNAADALEFWRELFGL